MSYLKETVVSAQCYKRPKQSGPDIVGHWGIVVQTKEGNSYLIHNTPGSGVVVTPASNMSGKWEKTNDINVTWNPTIQDCLRAGGVWFTKNPLVQYVASFFCIGTAGNIEAYLEDPLRFAVGGTFASELP